MMRAEPIKQADYRVLIFCGTWGLLIFLAKIDDMRAPEAVFPFTDYYLNTGVRSICIGTAVLQVAVFAVPVWFMVRKRLTCGVLMVLLLLLLCSTKMCIANPKEMKKNRILGVGALAAFTTIQAQSQRPNFVWVMIEDVAADYVTLYNSSAAPSWQVK